MLSPKRDAILLGNEIGRKFNNAIANICHAGHANQLKPPGFPTCRFALPGSLLARCARFGVL
jgi:hypothetical protein